MLLLLCSRAGRCILHSHSSSMSSLVARSLDEVQATNVYEETTLCEGWLAWEPLSCHLIVPWLCYFVGMMNGEEGGLV
jgi:hypothetical protein